MKFVCNKFLVLAAVFSLLSPSLSLAGQERSAVECSAEGRWNSYVPGSAICVELNNTVRLRRAMDHSFRICKEASEWNPCNVTCSVIKRSNCEAFLP